MAKVTPGTGETVNADTIEGKLFQLCHLINSAEKGLDTQKLNITKTDDLILEGDFTIPGTLTHNASTGIFTIAAGTYLPTLSFSAGDPAGTIKGTSLSQYFIDVVSYIVHWQKQSSKNPNSLINCTLNFDYNSLEYVGRIILPYTSILGQNGTVVETATEWLIT